MIVSLMRITENPETGPIKPSMKGNMLVSFSLWMAVTMFSLFVYGIQQRMLLCTIAIRCIRFFLKRILRVFKKFQEIFNIGNGKVVEF